MPKYSFTCQNCKENLLLLVNTRKSGIPFVLIVGAKKKKRYLSLWDMVPLKAFWIVWNPSPSSGKIPPLNHRILTVHTLFYMIV